MSDKETTCRDCVYCEKPNKNLPYYNVASVMSCRRVVASGLNWEQFGKGGCFHFTANPTDTDRIRYCPGCGKGFRTATWATPNGLSTEWLCYDHVSQLDATIAPCVQKFSVAEWLARSEPPVKSHRKPVTGGIIAKLGSEKVPNGPPPPKKGNRIRYCPGCGKGYETEPWTAVGAWVCDGGPRQLDSAIPACASLFTAAAWLAQTEPRRVRADYGSKGWGAILAEYPKCHTQREHAAWSPWMPDGWCKWLAGESQKHSTAKEVAEKESAKESLRDSEWYAAQTAIPWMATASDIRTATGRVVEKQNPPKPLVKGQKKMSENMEKKVGTMVQPPCVVLESGFGPLLFGVVGTLCIVVAALFLTRDIVWVRAQNALPQRPPTEFSMDAIVQQADYADALAVEFAIAKGRHSGWQARARKVIGAAAENPEDYTVTFSVGPNYYEPPITTYAQEAETVDKVLLRIRDDDYTIHLGENVVGIDSASP